jgi:hypothetical protein
MVEETSLMSWERGRARLRPLGSEVEVVRVLFPRSIGGGDNARNVNLFRGDRGLDCTGYEYGEIDMGNATTVGDDVADDPGEGE